MASDALQEPLHTWFRCFHLWPGSHFRQNNASRKWLHRPVTFHITYGSYYTMIFVGDFGDADAIEQHAQIACVCMVALDFLPLPRQDSMAYIRKRRIGWQSTASAPVCCLLPQFKIFVSWIAAFTHVCWPCLRQPSPPPAPPSSRYTIIIHIR